MAYLSLMGCQTPASYRLEADKVSNNIIREKQIQALGKKRNLA